MFLDRTGWYKVIISKITFSQLKSHLGAVDMLDKINFKFSWKEKCFKIPIKIIKNKKKIHCSKFDSYWEF